MKISNKLFAAAAVLAVTMGSQSAMAGTETGVVTVTATLTAACSIGTGTIAFGSFSGVNVGTAGSPSALSDNSKTSSAIPYVCTTGSSPAVTMDGANTATAQLNMKLTSGPDLIPYNVYEDSGYTIQITPGSATALSLTSDGTSHNLSIYGRIPGASYASQTVGAYSDDLTITVTY